MIAGIIAAVILALTVIRVSCVRVVVVDVG